MIKFLENTARVAGDTVLGILDQAKIKIIEKNDKSPVTKADLESELLIKKALKKNLLFQ